MYKEPVPEQVPFYLNGIGYNALRLAMSRSIAEETQLKTIYTKAGVQYVVTEVGGNSKQGFQEKIVRAILGAALSANLIEKNAHEVHALLHASEEAKRGILVNIASDVNLAVKIAIIREEHWIAVAIFGESAIHPYSSHERCGLGVMNI